MNVLLARFMLAAVTLLPMCAGAQQWRVISFEWQGKPAHVGAGNLDVEVVQHDKSIAQNIRDEHSFYQELKLKRKAKWFQVASCSLVENEDVYGEGAWGVLLEDGVHLWVQLDADEELLIDPRVCISAIQ